MRKIPVLRMNFPCLTAREIKQSLAWHFSKIPLLNMIYLFKKVYSGIPNTRPRIQRERNFARPQVENHFCKLIMVTSTNYSYLQLLKIYDNCALQTLYSVMEFSTQHHQCLTAYSPFMHFLAQPWFHWCILCFYSEMLTIIKDYSIS